jgi:hypothetical protein
MYLGLNNAGLNSRSNAFNPSNLFAKGEQGFFFVNDLPTMYQDSAGTTPAALEQPLGLWLDSKYGGVRGAELAQSGNIATAVGYGNVTTVNGLGFSTVGDGLAQTRVAIDIPTVANKTYEVTFVRGSFAVEAPIHYARNAAGGGGSTITNGLSSNSRLVFTAASATSSILWVASSSSASYTISAISVREIPGNHATQPTSANRPTVSARYNKCTNNNANPVDLTGMTKSGDAAAVLSVVDDSAALAAAVAAGVIPAGKATSGKVYLLDNTAGVAQAYANAAGTTGNLNSHTVSAYVRGTGTARVGTNSVATIPQTPLTGAYQRVVFTAASGTTGQTLYVTAEPGAVVYFILNDMRESVHAIPGIPTPQVVTGSGANYDSAGFPVRVKFNGTNQWMQTASVDLSGTDKATVFGGVTKLSDAAIGFPMEWGNVATGDTPNWTLNAPRGAGANTYGLDVRAAGIVSTVTPSGYSAPHSSILAGAIDRAGATISDQVKLRVNGALPAQGPNGSGPIAAGNFASFPAFIGCRGQGNSNFFNGDIYAMAARGAATSDAAIAWAEQDINARMGRVY